MSYGLTDQQRLKKLLGEQQAALQPGVHYHPMPQPQLGSSQHGLSGEFSAVSTNSTISRPAGMTMLRRPDSSPADSRMRTISGYQSPRAALPELRAKGLREEALRAANEGRITNEEAMKFVSPRNGGGGINNTYEELSNAADHIFSPSAPRVSSSRPSTANVGNNNTSSTRQRQLLVSSQLDSAASVSSPSSASVKYSGIPPRPPLDRQDLPAVQNLPSTTTHATSQPPRNAAEAMDEAKTANPFFVAHAPPAIDMRTGEPIIEEKQPTTSSPSSSSAYRASQHLSTSKASEFHESQREVLNLQLRGVADHALKMRRTVVDDVVEPIKIVANEAVDLCNGCTAALKSYEENYDCVYQVKKTEIPALMDELHLRTEFAELSRLLELPAIDPNTIRQALTELSAPVDFEDPREDTLRQLSQSRLDLCRRQLGKLDAIAGLSVADSALRMYEVLHADLLSAPRDLLATDEAALQLMQRDVEKLYIKRANLLDEVQSSTNRTAPLMADGPLSGTGAGSLAPGNTDSTMQLALATPGAASRQISALMAREGQDRESDEIRAQVQKQLIDSSPGRVRAHTVEALSPPRRGVSKDGVVVPEDTEDDTDGRKLAVVENTQRREVTISREILNRRTNRCNAMLDFVDGIRAFNADAIEQAKTGREINEANLRFIDKIINDTNDDMSAVTSTIMTERDADSQMQQQFALTQRQAHAELARLTQEEGSIWNQIRVLMEKAQEVGRERDALHEQRMIETELEARRQKIHRQRMEKLNQLNIQLAKMKKVMMGYEEAAIASDNFHKTFVADEIVPKLQQEEELVTLRGTEALAFATAFKNFIFSAEDLLARLEVRGKMLRQRQRAAGFDESVAHDSLDLAGRDSYLTEMKRLANMISETENKQLEVSDWIREGRESARAFMPIAAAARQAVRETSIMMSSMSMQRALEKADESNNNNNAHTPSSSAQQQYRGGVVVSPSPRNVGAASSSSSYRPGSSAATRKKAEEYASKVQDEDIEAAISARDSHLRDVDRAEEVLSRQKQTAEQQVESLRSEIRRVKKENEAQIRQFASSNAPK